MSPEPGLYVHVPFCSAICPYCDFAVTRDEPRRRERFASALLAEADLLGAPERPADTLYFGGGTPSRLDASDLARAVEGLRDRGWSSASARIFLEANPEDVRKETLDGWRGAGVRTLSLGVQSLDDDALRFLGRRHTASGARAAVETARAAGFDTLSVDLMYGLPGQTREDWERVLGAALALEPDHLSCYQLTVHEGTIFGRRAREGMLVESDEERQASLFHVTHERLAGAGYEGYEVSNFARSPEHRSAHNEKYWSHAPYVGLGPSAHSFDGRRRTWNERSFFAWEKRLLAQASPEAGGEDLDEEALLLETLMLRLRTRDGLDLDAFETRFGVDLLEEARSVAERAFAEGLLALEPPRIRPTLGGLAVADGLARALYGSFERS